MPRQWWLIIAFAAAALAAAAEAAFGANPESRSASLTGASAALAKVGMNFNGGEPLEPEFSEHIYRSAAQDQWPVPEISASDLAQGVLPVVVAGRLHALSGSPARLTDGSGASTNDDPAGSCFFDNGVTAGLLRISLPAAQSIGQINLYAWHRDPLSGGSRAPLKVNVYASDGIAAGFDSDNPRGPGYVLLARVDTVRTGGANAQSGQHAASIVPVHGQSLGNYKHFLLEILPPVDGLTHTFLNEIDIVRAVVSPLAAPTTAAAKTFDTQIAPLLARRCLECHNSSDKKGGLDLSQPQSALAGGESGAALVPGKADESLLLDRVEQDEMPPKHPLPDGEKKLLRRWVASGAVWGSTIDRFRYSSDARAGYDWWSLAALKQPALPKVRRENWATGAIDRFVLAGLESKGLAPSPEADRRTLIRRVTLDLIGLPPTPEEVDAFATDTAPDAYARLVERLLASPHYGERWARHWLDIVRFAESQGFERNKYYPSAWKYRDWVIQSLNDDLPYDEFIRLQIAGDVLRPADPQALVAAGYLVCSPHDLLGQIQGSEGMKAATREEELENLVSNIGQTVLGLTINCARCHDHKFDPLRQTEYYQMAAAVGGFRRADRDVPPLHLAAFRTSGGKDAAVRSALARLAEAIGPRGAEIIRQARADGLREVAQALSAAQAALAQAEQKLAPVEAQVGKTDAPADILVAVANGRQVVVDRQRELRAAKDEQRYAQNASSTCGFDRLLEMVPAERRAACAGPIVALSQLDVRSRLESGGATHSCASLPPQYFHVLARGNYRSRESVVTARGLKCIASLPADWGLPPGAPEADRRAKLAEWITDSRNPLPARVIVNRLWHYHFGAGLVETPSDFGFSGGRPSHPELLDFLAVELQQHGWSLKHIQRQIVMSAAYRQSGKLNPQAAAADAGNRLLWRKAPLRMEAEVVRDAVLSIAGELNPRMGGPSFRDLAIAPSGDNAAFTPLDAFAPAVNRRSVYRMVVRAATPPLLETLDCADPTVATPRRSVTTTPLQALSLLNNPFMLRAADRFAVRVRREAGQEPHRQVARAYRLALGRAASEREQHAAKQFAAKYGLADLCLMLFNSNEFLYID